MVRLIDANALYTELVKMKDFGELTAKKAIRVVEKSPTIDAELVRHGKWKWLSCTYDRVPREKEYECSECHHKTIVHGDDMPWEKYCPNCGARMDEE